MYFLMVLLQICGKWCLKDPQRQSGVLFDTKNDSRVEFLHLLPVDFTNVTFLINRHYIFTEEDKIIAIIDKSIITVKFFYSETIFCSCTSWMVGG